MIDLLATWLIPGAAYAPGDPENSFWQQAQQK
jgi:hypothetical protein